LPNWNVLPSRACPADFSEPEKARFAGRVAPLVILEDAESEVFPRSPVFPMTELRDDPLMLESAREVGTTFLVADEFSQTSLPCPEKLLVTPVDPAV